MLTKDHFSDRFTIKITQQSVEISDTKQCYFSNLEDGFEVPVTSNATGTEVKFRISNRYQNHSNFHDVVSHRNWPQQYLGHSSHCETFRSGNSP